MSNESRVYGAEYLIKLDCGCVYDSLNKATMSFCEKHQEEHDRWIENVKKEVS